MLRSVELKSHPHVFIHYFSHILELSAIYARLLVYISIIIGLFLRRFPSLLVIPLFLGYSKDMSRDNQQHLLRQLEADRGYRYYSLAALQEERQISLDRLPYSIKILLESLLHHCNGREITTEHVDRMLQYDPLQVPKIEFPFRPARVLLQDFTGVPCVVDLAAMRSAVQRVGGDAARINPALPVDLVIDHSVQVDHFNSPQAFHQNASLEFKRNRERYELLRWGQKAFHNFRVVPPASGICHQVNLEYLGKVVQQEADNQLPIAYLDSCVGTDSHTPMINGLGILGWGVGGIEAEAAMLGQPIFMLAPAVVGVKIHGALRPGITATDLVLRITQMLRQHGVVGKFVEFCGSGLSAMSVPDRATISNMAPEYGATVGYFPVDERTLEYMHATGRSQSQIELVRAYTQAQGLFRNSMSPEPRFETLLELNLEEVESSIAGPKRPQDRVSISKVSENWQYLLGAPLKERGFALTAPEQQAQGLLNLKDGSYTLTHGSVVIAAITSCTNTSNPSVLIAAGLLAKRALECGLRTKPWVKTSFAPGSMVVTEYLQRTGLMRYLEELGYYLVGYGCTTCIGNSGPLPSEIAKIVEEQKLVVAGVLSGNRNFEGRINPHTRANYLASPPLVVAYGLAGTINIDLTQQPLGTNDRGEAIYLHDIWPDEAELQRVTQEALNREAFIESYNNLENANPQWNSIKLDDAPIYRWRDESSYIQEPPFFQEMALQAGSITPIKDARVLVVAGDSVTTDHISPAGAIDPKSPAGRFLQAHGVTYEEFNSYGSRRGNDKIMSRGTFANIRFRNLLTPEIEGGYTRYFPSDEVLDIFEAAQRYKAEEIPTIVLAGQDYGMGSSRDWAAKGPYLLGIKAVIAVSYERIHRSNLVGMGILPLQFMEGDNCERLGLDGTEHYHVAVDEHLLPGSKIAVTVSANGRSPHTFDTLCRIDSPIEVKYYRHGGILQYVLRKFMA